MAIIGAIIFPLPAILNFTLNELGKIKNNNYRRFITGALLGNVIGLALQYLISGYYLFGVLIIIWILLLEIIVVIILHKANVIERFIEQYEDGIYKK